MDKECKICGKKKNIEKHHISYEKNITINLCRHHHNMVHRQKNHEFYPVDERQLLKVTLNKENSDNFKIYFKKKRNLNNVINTIIKNRLEDGHFELRSEFGKPYSDVMSWSEFKKVGGSFLLKDPKLLSDFLESVYHFSGMKRGILTDCLLDWLLIPFKEEKK
jgi:hypothetical protein